MMALARAMNASMTRARFSVQMWSLRKPRLCQEFEFHDPAGSGLWRSAFGADHEVAAETGEKFTGLAGVVTASGCMVISGSAKPNRSATRGRCPP